MYVKEISSTKSFCNHTIQKAAKLGMGERCRKQELLCSVR